MKLSFRMARLAPVLVAAALPLFLAQDRTGRALAQDDDDEASSVETKFTRFRETKRGGKLEVAFATYKNKDSEVELVLYGAVHIADKAYYKKVQQDLDACDVVLYEGVTPSKDTTKEPDESMKTIGELQTGMGKMLGLTFQKDGINYKAKNLVHADMTYDELLKATDGDISKALPGAGMFSDPAMKKQLKAALDMMKGSGLMDAMPGVRDQIKLMMARQLADADMSKIAGGADATKILVGERNKVALKVLDKQLETTKSGRIAIFYGAAHMKDFHERLAKKGWTQSKVEWNAAWDIGAKKKKTADDEEAPSPAAPEREREKQPADKGKARWF